MIQLNDGYAETEFDPDTYLQEYFNATKPKEGPMFSTWEDPNPQPSTEVLDKTEEAAFSAWQRSGSGQSFSAWVAEQERKANRKAKWSKVGNRVLDFILDYVAGGNSGQPDVQPPVDGGGLLKDYEAPLPEDKILGMPKTTAYWVLGITSAVLVGTTIVLLARRKPSVQAAG